MKPFLYLIFAIALCGFSACNSNQNKTPDTTPTEGETTIVDKDSLDQLRQQQIQDSIQQAEQAKLEEEAQNKEAMYRAYQQILQKNYPYNNYYASTGYYLMDFTGNGAPELIIKTGTCEADYELEIYTFTNGVAKKIYNSSACHATLYRDGSCLIKYTTFMGEYFMEQLSYNGSVRTKTLYKHESNLEQESPEEEYPDAPGHEITLNPFKNSTALKKAIGI